MNLAELGKTVAKYAPAIGALLPLPGGAAIGTAIAAAFGGDIKDPAALASKIQQDPQAAIKLAELQNNLAISMRQAEVKEREIDVDDKKSAREQYVELNKAGDPDKTLPDKTARNIAYMVVIGFLLQCFMIPFLPIDRVEVQIIMVLVGMLAAKFNSIVDFFFGNSKSSETIMHMFATLANKKRLKQKEKLDLPEPRFNEAA
jgi:hypothetical protein